MTTIQPLPKQKLSTQLEGRLAALRTARQSWWVHWAELARYILPRRYRWLVSPNQMNRGSAINGAIIDSTGTVASRVLSSGMMSGITSPTRPWFKLRIQGYTEGEVNEVNIWLADCERRMRKVFQESNFYNSIATVYADLGVFGTGPMLIYEDYENIINCINPCAGEYYLGVNNRGYVDVFYREIVMTVAALCKEFGDQNLSNGVREDYKRGGASLQNEVVVCHALEPNIEDGVIPKMFKYREFYWERGNTADEQGEDRFLRKKGYHELPGVFPRWDVVGEDAYGRSPGMDALGDIKQLQQETKRKAQAIDKLANPPMIADVEMKNQPASTLPGNITYIASKNGVGFKPAYENFRPPIQELMQDIKEVQERIKNIFFNDLFLMISQLDTVRTATEIDARREEKLIMVGPVLERFQTEALDQLIERTFAIMDRGNLFLPAPDEIQGAPIQIEYVSMLAQAQAAVAASGIERTMQVAGNIVAVDQTIMDNLNLDEIIRYYGGLMSVPPHLMNSSDAVKKIRENRQKEKADQAAMAAAPVAADAAKNLSATDVGGGKNALESMLNAGSSMQ